MKLHVEAVFDPKEESFMNSAGKDPLEVEVKEDVQLLKQFLCIYCPLIPKGHLQLN